MSDPSLAHTIANAKRELEHMMDVNPQVMLLASRDARVVRANRALLELTGRSAFSDVLGALMGDLFAGAGDGFFASVLSEAAGVGSVDGHVTLPNGFVRELRFTFVSTRLPEEPVLFVVVDITGEKERILEEERRHKREAVAALIGALMHNIGQPLTVMTVRARLMQAAINAEEIDRAELAEHVTEMAELTMQVKTMLEKVENARAYITERYLEGDVEILDLERL